MPSNVDAYQTFLSTRLIRATIAVANATGGATGAALTLDTYNLSGATRSTAVRQMLIVGGDSLHSPSSFNANISFGTATKGSIISTGTGWALIETDSNGEFDCTVTNAVDETVYFSVRTASGGVDTVGNYCVVAGSNADAATWSA